MKRKTRIIILTMIVIVVGITVLRLDVNASKNTPSVEHIATKTTANNYCQNQTEQAILVSIEKRHLWACKDNKTMYDSPVITGDMNNADNLTPVGTYKIYAKEADRYLKGSDDKGSWNKHVDYWMPFLDNQYGTYGFHDAIWRKEGDFGEVDPYSTDASHGCVELPSATSKWLYEWSSVGTKVVISN